MAKFYRGNVVDGAIVFSPEGVQVFSGMRGKPSADMLVAECDSQGNLLGNHRPVLLAELKKQEAQRKKLEAALAPRSSKAASAVKRWHMKPDGSVVPFGTGPVSFEKWARQVYGENDHRLIRENCTEEEFAAWKVSQNYVARTGGGNNGPKLRDELASMRDQLAQQAAAAAAREERLIALLEQQAAASAPTANASGKQGKGKAQQPE